MQKLKLIGFCFTILLKSSIDAQADCSKLRQISPLDPPKKLSDLMAFEDLGTLKPCSDAVEYAVNSPLWSDGAGKKRWIVLPPNKKIQFRADESWDFPAGTWFIKHFGLNVSSTKTVRVETRFFIHDMDGVWYGFTYQWQDDQKDAVLLDNYAKKDFQIEDPTAPGGVRNQTWTYPSPEACLTCHTPWAGYALGVRTEQLNFVPGVNGLNQNQLQVWDEKNFFKTKIGDVSQYPVFPNPNDPNQPLEKRMKSYLASNCSHCHQPDSPVPAGIDLRFKTSVYDMGIINGYPVAGNMGFIDPYIVKPGSKENSILWLRMKSTTTLRMPPVAVNIPDQSAIDVVGAWIDSLDPNQMPPLNHRYSLLK